VKLIVQIPCLNEVATLANVISGIPKAIPGIDVIETLIVDDGSTDGTAELAHAIGVDYVIRHDRNRGLAAAFMTGVRSCVESGADIIVNTDGDHQYPGELIPELIRPIVCQQFDMVLGDRRPTRDHSIPLGKRSLYWLGAIAVGLATGQRRSDPVSSFRALSRRFAEQLEIRGSFSYTVESLVVAKAIGAAVCEVPIYVNRPARKSRLSAGCLHFVLKTACQLILTLIRQRVSPTGRSIGGSVITLFLVT